MDNPTVLRTASLLGLSTSLYLSGIYFSASHLTIPIIRRLPVETSTSAFTELYYRGAKTVVPLALFSTFCTGVSAYLGPSKRVGYAITAVATIASLPWTGVVMKGVNERLIAIGKEAHAREKTNEGEVEQLLRQWKWMNNVRAGLAAVGGIVGLVVATDVL